MHSSSRSHAWWPANLIISVWDNEWPHICGFSISYHCSTLDECETELCNNTRLDWIGRNMQTLWQERNKKRWRWWSGVAQWPMSCRCSVAPCVVVYRVWPNFPFGKLQEYHICTETFVILGYHLFIMTAVQQTFPATMTGDDFRLWCRLRLFWNLLGCWVSTFNVHDAVCMWRCN